MSKTKITSKNQSGGITAQNVSFDNGSNQFNVPDNGKKERNWKKIILTISGIVAFIASVVTILAYFNIFSI
jgi:hypothetical protein